MATRLARADRCGTRKGSVTSTSLVRVTYPLRHAGVIVCLDHLTQLGDVERQHDHRHDAIDAEVVASQGHRCLMCGVDAVSDRLCESADCRRPLHPQWPSVYCCNLCALEDV